MENKKTQKGKIIILAVAAVIILVAAGVFAFKSSESKLKYGTEAFNIVNRYFKQPQYSMLVAVNPTEEESAFSTEAVMYKNTLEEKEIITIQWNNMTSHYCEEKLYFDNGTVFDAEGVFDEFKKLVYRIGDIYKSVDVSKQEAYDTVQYTVEVSDKELFSNIVALTGLTDSENIPDMRITVIAQITEQGEQLSSINIYADDTVTGQTEFVVDLTAFDEKYELSENIAQMIIKGEVQQTIQLSDIQLLAKAWENYFSYPVYGADVELDVDCAFFNFDQQFTMLSTKETGKDITCIKRGDLELFIVDGQLYSERWGKLTDIETAVFLNAEKVFEIAYQLCLSQDFSVTTTEGKTVYRVSMTAEEFKQLLQTATNQTEINASFDSGYLEIEVDGQNLCSMDFECNGKIDAFISEIGVEVTLDIDFYEGNIENINLPASVQ